MTKLLMGLAFAGLVLTACQKEIDPIEPPSTPTPQSTDTIKALVFDGPLDPAFPTADYDSLVFSINNSSSSISHYYRGTLAGTEYLNYDNQGRVSSYRVYWASFSYRYVHYTYSGTGKIPVSINDSLYDNQLLHYKINLLQTNPVGSGKEMIYRTEYETTGYSDIYNLKVHFDQNERMLWDANVDSFGYEEVKSYYNGNGLLDSSVFRQRRPSATSTDSLVMKWTMYDNPLHGLSQLLYKNLSAYTMMTWGWFGHHLALSTLPEGIFEAKFPLSNKLTINGNNFISYDFNYQFQNQKLTSMKMQASNFVPQTSQVNVRIY